MVADPVRRPDSVVEVIEARLAEDPVVVIATSRAGALDQAGVGATRTDSKTAAGGGRRGPDRDLQILHPRGPAPEARVLLVGGRHQLVRPVRRLDAVGAPPAEIDVQDRELRSPQRRVEDGHGPSPRSAPLLPPSAAGTPLPAARRRATAGAAQDLRPSRHPHRGILDVRDPPPAPRGGAEKGGMVATAGASHPAVAAIVVDVADHEVIRQGGRVVRTAVDIAVESGSIVGAVGLVPTTKSLLVLQFHETVQLMFPTLKTDRQQQQRRLPAMNHHPPPLGRLVGLPTRRRIRKKSRRPGKADTKGLSHIAHDHRREASQRDAREGTAGQNHEDEILE